MLSAIRNSDSNKVFAAQESKTNRPFSCAMCNGEVILKKGPINIHHFAHKPPYDCSYGKGESDEHHRCKLEIYESLIKQPNVTKCEIERNLQSVRPDISCYIGNIPVAIEVQISALGLDEIIYRTIEYKQKGIFVLWLLLFSDKLRGERYAPRIWEKWLHSTYFGRVYYWNKGLTVIPVHFDDHYLYVEENTWFEPGGVERSEGGYYKLSKRYRTPKIGQATNLVRDFKKLERSPLVTANYTVPESNILFDTQPNWWKSKPQTQSNGWIKK